MTPTPTPRHDAATRVRQTARRVAPSVALGVPLVLVNAAAVYGQAAWAYDHLTNPVWSPAARWTLAVLFAITVESVGIYLAFEAHLALMAGDASVRLRLASYGIGALVGGLNYAHFATPPGYQPNPLAVTFGLLSSISPWLWAIRSRSMNRDRLRALGQIDPRAVRFSPLRWALYPRQTWRAFRAAVWAGVVAPADAVALVSRSTVAAPTSVAPKTRPPAVAPPATPTAKTVAIDDAPRDTDSDTKPAPALTKRRGGGDTVADRARQLWAPGKSAAAILLQLGLPATDANRRKVERATQKLRQAAMERGA